MAPIETRVSTINESIQTSPEQFSKKTLTEITEGLSSGTSSPTPSSPLPCSSISSDKTDNHDNHDSFLTPYSGVDKADMRREDERLKTFANWPIDIIKPEDLARNGFYYLGRGDEVRCAFCKVEIMRWMAGDDPKSDHQRWAPQCPFLKQQADSCNASTELIGSGRDECGLRTPIAGTSQLPMPGAVHQRYATESARLRSFKDWPRSMPQKPEDLAEAGFFYTGQGDKTKCFYCDGGLKDWEAEDVPWEQHARWFDRCAFVLLNKGRDYVQRVITEARAIPPQKDTVPPPAEPVEETNKTETKKEEDSDNPKHCKICYEGELNVAFVPCGHVVACAKCALVNNKCPVCRRTYTSAVRLYYS